MGLAAVILATALGIGWTSAIIIAALPITDPITDTGAGLLTGIGQVLAGAVATYLGSQIGRQQHADTERGADSPPEGS